MKSCGKIYYGAGFNPAKRLANGTVVVDTSGRTKVERAYSIISPRKALAAGGVAGGLVKIGDGKKETAAVERIEAKEIIPTKESIPEGVSVIVPTAEQKTEETTGTKMIETEERLVDFLDAAEGVVQKVEAEAAAVTEETEGKRKRKNRKQRRAEARARQMELAATAEGEAAAE